MSSDRQDPLLPGPFGHISVERRRSHRETVVAIGRIAPIDADDRLRSIQVLVTDISLHGCDFRSSVAPREGTFYRIELTVGPLSLTSRMRITRVQRRGDGTHEMGAEFI
jgi:hypothetical protein